MRKIILLLGLFWAVNGLAQDNDPVLFTVGGDEVNVSEFRYIYEKNNADNANYSMESIEEYLELYKKFKLKVHKAREIGLDTVKSLQKELAGYRKQLANSYLKDKEISNRLVDEVVDRMKTDKKVSHIFIGVNKKGGEQAERGAEEKIYDIYNKLVSNKGLGFDQMAKTLSEDKISAKKDGALGYYVAPLPDGFYEFENAMYSTEVGKFSEPFRSKMGYHIVKVEDARPARGEMEIAHILIRKESKGKVNPNAKSTIDSVYTLLQSGQTFEKLVPKFSEDSKTKSRAGYIGFFGVNQYEKAFEDAAFALTEDNSYTKPVSTKVGYHIIKRISKRDNSNEDRLKKRVEQRIKNNDRFATAQKKLIEDVKKDAKFTENKQLISQFEKVLNETFYSYKWETPNFDEQKALFTLGKKSYDLNDFAKWSKGNVRERLKFPKTTPLNEASQTMYDIYLEEKVMAYEEANLENKYPDFKALMREYREGILLFEITKNEVWDKASQDTIGLRSYFDQHRDDYKWGDRVQTNKITLESSDPSKLDDFKKLVDKKGLDKAIDKYKKESGFTVNQEEVTLELMDQEIRGLKHTKGSATELMIDKNTAHLYTFVQNVSSSYKTLKEARGYVIADYQDYLEQKWVEGLKKDYPIKVDNKVLKSLTK